MKIALTPKYVRCIWKLVPLLCLKKGMQWEKAHTQQICLTAQQEYPYKGSGGKEKLPLHRVPRIGIQSQSSSLLLSLLSSLSPSLSPLLLQSLSPLPLHLVDCCLCVTAVFFVSVAATAAATRCHHLSSNIRRKDDQGLGGVVSPPRSSTSS